jgi:hypothetical protein
LTRNPLPALIRCLAGHLIATTLVVLLARFSGFDVLSLSWSHIPLGAVGVGALATVPAVGAAKRGNLRVGPGVFVGAAICGAAGITWYWIVGYIVALIQVGASPAEVPFGAWLGAATARLDLAGMSTRQSVDLRGGDAIGWYAIQALLYVGGAVVGSRRLGSAKRCATCDQYSAQWPVVWVDTPQAADASLALANDGDVVAWDRAHAPGPPGARGAHPYELRAIACPTCGVGYLGLWDHSPGRRQRYLRQVRVGREMGVRLVAAR